MTIFGESAGGLSVHSQLASPLARRAVPARDRRERRLPLTQPSLADGRGDRGTPSPPRVGCADQTAACLRSLPVADDPRRPDRRRRSSPRTSTASCSPQSISDRVRERAVQPRAGDRGHRTTTSGGCSSRQAEAADGAPLTAAGYPSAIAATLGVPPGRSRPRSSTQYPLGRYPSPSVALGAVGTDAIFACNARKRARGRCRSSCPPTRTSSTTRTRRWLSLPAGRASRTGASHASELQYLFDEPTLPLRGRHQELLSAAMVRYWTSSRPPATRTAPRRRIGRPTTRPRSSSSRSSRPHRPRNRLRHRTQLLPLGRLATTLPERREPLRPTAPRARGDQASPDDPHAIHTLGGGRQRVPLSVLRIGNSPTTRGYARATSPPLIPSVSGALVASRTRRCPRVPPLFQDGKERFDGSSP